MAVKRKAKRCKKKKGFIHHLVSPGFSNRLAIYILLFLAAGLADGFYFANESIRTGYTGALMCWTVIFTPIDTACNIVPSKIVHESEAENIGGNGDGIKFAIAMSDAVNDDGSSWENPAI